MSIRVQQPTRFCITWNFSAAYHTLNKHTPPLESFWNFLIKLDMKPFKHFLLNNVTTRAMKIMDRADKNWAHFQNIKYYKDRNYFENQNLRCSRRLFIILESLTMTLFSKKCLFPLDAYMVLCPTRSKSLERALTTILPTQLML